jgi:predicted nucleic acid-binding protein
MARSFLDTSALVKYYHPEEGTEEVTQFVQEHNARHYISRLGIVEAQHAFALKLQTGDITEIDFALLLRHTRKLIIPWCKTDKNRAQ